MMIRERWERFIYKQFDRMNLVDKYYQVGGHCGLCGKWVDDEILPQEWAITICNACLHDSGETAK